MTWRLRLAIWMQRYHTAAAARLRDSEEWHLARAAVWTMRRLLWQRR